MIHRMLFAAALALVGTLPAQEHAEKPAAAATPAAKPAFETRPALYPLSTCIVSGEALDGDAVTFQVDGSTFKTCCDKCKAKVEKDPAAFKAKLEEATAKMQAMVYPLTECVISGEKLGGMGEPVKLVLDGTLVELCCKHCTAKAKAKPAELAAKVVAAAHAQQAAKYPLATCIVSGEKLEADAKDVMFGTTLVRTCCDKCAAKVAENPTKYMAMLHDAYAKAGAAGAEKADGHGKDGAHGKDAEHGEHGKD